MSETTDKQGDRQPPVGWFDVWHPRGVKVRMPTALTAESYRVEFDSVSAALDAGWLVQAPGLDAGENVEEIGHVVRKEKLDQQGHVTPILDCYSTQDGYNFSFITIYLNNDEQVKEFEAVSGVSVFKLPIYEGNDKIERGKNPQTDRKVCKVPKPFRLVWIHNPKWNAEDAKAAQAGGKMYAVPKKRFIRFADAPAIFTPSPAAPTQQPAGNGRPQTQVDENVVQRFRDQLALDPPVHVFNDHFKDYQDMPKSLTKEVIRRMIAEHAGLAGFQYDAATQRFFVPTGEGQTSEVPF